jgi:hypothetical protein
VQRVRCAVVTYLRVGRNAVAPFAEGDDLGPTLKVIESALHEARKRVQQGESDFCWLRSRMVESRGCGEGEIEEKTGAVKLSL